MDDIEIRLFFMILIKHLNDLSGKSAFVRSCVRSNRGAIIPTKKTY